MHRRSSSSPSCINTQNSYCLSHCIQSNITIALSTSYCHLRMTSFWRKRNPMSLVLALFSADQFPKKFVRKRRTAKEILHACMIAKYLRNLEWTVSLSYRNHRNWQKPYEKGSSLLSSIKSFLFPATIPCLWFSISIIQNEKHFKFTFIWNYSVVCRIRFAYVCI